MFDLNLPHVLDSIGDDHRVLDVGGWAKPFTRADWVVDIMPYDNRGWAGRQGPERERFSRDSWVQMDVNSKERLPFEDKFFDFVVCSHTLEDIRDPVFLCSELNRVAKRGYLETPSMLAELAFGTESRAYAGYYHHRWLVEMDPSRARVVFLMKPHFIHGSWQYHIPKRMCRRLTPQQRVTWLFWEGGFGYMERVEIDMVTFKRILLEFVRHQGAYPDWRYATIPPAEKLGQIRNLIGTHARRALGGVR